MTAYIFWYIAMVVLFLVAGIVWILWADSKDEGK
jgi:cbb3-type cytochrome oxidase subunit 3